MKQGRFYLWLMIGKERDYFFVTAVEPEQDRLQVETERGESYLSLSKMEANLGLGNLRAAGWAEALALGFRLDQAQKRQDIPME